jgi:hypothetical protein
MSMLLLLILALDTAAATAPQRSAKDILSDYQKAIGDEAAWKHHKTAILKREITIKAMRFTGTETLKIAKGGKLISDSMLPGMGAFRMATNGKVAWSQDPINGLRILKGSEAEDLRLAAVWNPEWRLLSLYKSSTVVPPPDEAKGAVWECIEFGKAEGKAVTLCFDAVTHLRVLEKGVKSSPGGEMPYVSRYADWRKVDNVLVWHQEELVVGPITMEAKITSLTFDQPIPAKDFELPKAKKK